MVFDNIYSGRDNGMFTNDTGYDSKISGIIHAVSLCLIYADSDFPYRPELRAAGARIFAYLLR